jgi:hypothetical protein
LCQGTGLGELSLRDLDNTDRETLDAVEAANPQLRQVEYAQWYSEKYIPFRERVLSKAKKFHWGFKHSIPESTIQAWLVDTATVAQNIRAMGRKKPERFTRSLDKFGDCPHCQYKEICFDDSPELRTALFHVQNLRAALPKELQERQKEEERKKSDEGLDWL